MKAIKYLIKMVSKYFLAWGIIGIMKISPPVNLEQEQVLRETREFVGLD
jgi:hypothetical protein